MASYSYGFQRWNEADARKKASANLEYVFSGQARRDAERHRDAERNKRKRAREAAATKRELIRDAKLKLRILRNELEELTPVWEEMMDLYTKYGTDLHEHSDYTYGSLEELDHRRDTVHEKIYDLECELRDLKWEN